jgi:hypothetical protein
MKKAVVYFVIGMIAAVSLAIYLLGKRPSAEKPSVEANKAAQTVPAEVSSSQESTPQPPPLELSARAMKADPSRSNELVLATEQARAKAIKIHPGQLLASVNGVPITLRDLIAVNHSESADTEHSMSEAQYNYLLERAIDRELAFQAAQQQGVKLSQSQQAELDQVERSIRGRSENPSGDVLARLNSTASLETEIEFEKRDAAGLLTQEALLEHSGGPPAHITEEMVTEYYQKNISLYGPLPTAPEERDAAWRQIDAQIRTDLKYTVLQAHQDALKDNMDRLKANAAIEVSNVKDQPAKPASP